MAAPPLQWYWLNATPPYWPCYCNGKGAVSRKLEKDRYRPTTEAGAPRITSSMRLGTRIERAQTMQDKLDSVEHKLRES